MLADISPIPSRTRHSSWKVVGPILGVALMILILVALGVRNYKRYGLFIFCSLPHADYKIKTKT